MTNKLSCMKILCLSVVLIILITGCKKDNAKRNCLLNQAKFTSAGTPAEITSYEYDGQDRIKKITYSSSANTYEYFTDSVVISGENNRTTYFLGTGGLASSARMIFLQSVNNLQFDYVFTYDTEGFLTGEKTIFSQVINGNFFRDTSFTNYTVLNGNVVKAISTGWSDEQNYEYSTYSLPGNNPSLNLFPSAAGNFLGKAPKNLVSRIKDSGGNILADISYSFDPIRNIGTRIYKNPDPNGGIFTTEFTYHCN